MHLLLPKLRSAGISSLQTPPYAELFVCWKLACLKEANPRVLKCDLPRHGRMLIGTCVLMFVFAGCLQQYATLALLCTGCQQTIVPGLRVGMT